jgi:tetratricopeptide (TPR) repeat protein
MTEHRRNWWICLSLLLVTLGLYSSVRHFEFVDFDDPDYATVKQVRDGVTPDAVKWALTSGDAANWMPLTRLTHLIDYQLYGPQSGPPHVENAIIHALACVLLFLFLRRATGAYWKSAIVAAVFAWHPLHVESVAWVAERKDVLCAFFWFLTLWLWVRYTERPGGTRYALALVAFFLGLLSKPMIVTLPIVLLLLDWWPLWREFSAKLLVEKLPFFVLTAADSVVTFLVQHRAGAVGRLETYPPGLRLSNVLVSYLVYLGKTILPLRLEFWYPYPQSIPWWYAFVCGAAILLACVAILRPLAKARMWRTPWLAWKAPWLAIGWLWFFVTLVPVIGLVQVGMQARADRYMYVPMAGVLIGLIWTGERLLAGNRRLAIAAGIAVCVLPLPLTWAQIQTWRDSRALFTHAIEVDRGNYVAYNNLGTLEDKLPGHQDAAWAAFDAARGIRPDFAPAWYNLGRIELARGDFSRANGDFEEALRLKPDYSDARNNLGVLLGRQGRWNEAIPQFEQAIQLNPDLADARRNLGEALLKTRRTNEAIVTLEMAASIDADDAETHNLLGFALAQNPARREQAIGELQKAVALNPTLVSAHANLGRLLAMDPARRDEAIEELQAALRLNPADGGIRALLDQMESAPK